jgi:hypothetical protein
MKMGRRNNQQVGLSEVRRVWSGRLRFVGIATLAAVAATFVAIGRGEDVNTADAAPEVVLPPLPPTASLTREDLGRPVPAAKGRAHLEGRELKTALGEARKLGGGQEVLAPLTGSLVPVAVDSRGGETVYSSWQQVSSPKPSDPKAGTGQGVKPGDVVGIPSLRVMSKSGADRLLERGAYAPAVSRDGRLAYAKGSGDEVRQDQDYLSSIMVRSPINGPAEAWTDADAVYFPFGWAGSTLLAYRQVEDSEAVDLYALSGPGKRRLLAPEAFVIAVSPNGSRVLATIARRTVAIIDVASGGIESSISLDGGASSAGPMPSALMYNGSWVGNRAVANSDVGLVVLDTGGTLRIESVLTTSSGVPSGLKEPMLLDGGRVVGWIDVGDPPAKEATDEPAYDNALVECDLTAASCVVGTPKPARTWTRWVSNPSR